MTRVASAVVGGALIGALYAISPVTVWAVGLGVAMFSAAARGLTTAERQTLWAIGVTALTVRAIAIAAMLVVGIPAHNDLATGALSGDEAYNLGRALRARDVILERPVAKYDYFITTDEYGDSSYLSWLTWVQVVAGPTPYSMRLLNAVLFAGGALLLFRMARRAYGSLVAFSGLALLLIIPSLAASSISLLKEPAYFTLSALLVWSVVRAVDARGVSVRIGAVLLGALALVLLDDLRRGALLLAGSGVTLALVMRVALLRRWTAAAVAAAGIAVVAAVGMSDGLQARALAGLESAAKLHSGHVFTVGHAYKLLDQGFYVNPQATAASTLTLTPAQAGRFVVRGIASFLVAPLPWNMASRRELLFLPELLLWIGVIALVPVGVWVGWHANPTVTAVLLCYSLPTAAAVALTTGNVGTLLRLRGLALPYLLWLAVLALLTLMARLLRRVGT